MLTALALDRWPHPALADDLTVASTNDAGKGSLRAAIAQAKPEEPIASDLPVRSPYADQRGLPRVGAPDMGAFEARMGYVA